MEDVEYGDNDYSNDVNARNRCVQQLRDLHNQPSHNQVVETTMRPERIVPKAPTAEHSYYVETQAEDSSPYKPSNLAQSGTITDLHEARLKRIRELQRERGAAVMPEVSMEKLNALCS